MTEPFPGDKKPQDLTPEEIETLDRTDKFIVPPDEAEETQESFSAIVGRAQAKEAELIKSVEDSMMGIMGEPVHVVSFRYLGDGRFEVVVAHGENQKKTLVVKDPGGDAQ